MSINMFLELDGIKGESHDAGHKEKIDVLAWAWGLSNTGTFHHGMGGGAGRANFKSFTIRKYIDKATCHLMHHAACGRRISKGALYIRKAGGSPLDYLVFKFADVTVTYVFPKLSGERGTETIALNFAKIEAEYKTQDQRGLGKAAGLFTWNPQSFEHGPTEIKPAWVEQKGAGLTCTFELNGKSMSALKYKDQSIPAFSGFGQRVNRREFACVANAGPIPPGVYYIVDRQSGGVLGKLRDLFKDRSEWFALYANDGKVDDEIFCDKVKRGHFRLHPKGALGISEGCITIENHADFKKLRALLLRTQQIPVPGTELKGYGKVVVK